MMTVRRAAFLLFAAALLALAARELPARAQQPTATSAAGQEQVCANTLPTRLIVHERGRVELGDPAPLNLRAEAGTSSEKLGEIAPGGLFYVLAGPRCTALYSWYRVEVRAGGQVLRGWIAEGSVSEGYFAEPYPPGR